MSGLDVCREIRRRGLDTPIIMLTARAEEVDRVVGLEIGADDYVTKPFSVRELVARIRVRLRRLGAAIPNVARYEFDDVLIDFDKHFASRNGDALDLTPREFEILRLLIRRRGEVVTRDRMLDEIWGYDSSTTTRTVDTAIFKLPGRAARARAGSASARLPGSVDPPGSHRAPCHRACGSP